LTKSLKEIYKEAIEDENCTNLSAKGYESRMLHGVQIIKDNETKKISIYNPRGMDYYVEITPQEYEYFNKGWRYGVYQMTIDKYNKRLETIKIKIAQEMNGNKSPKSIDNLKKRRMTTLNKYYKIKQNLNKLK